MKTKDFRTVPAHRPTTLAAAVMTLYAAALAGCAMQPEADTRSAARAYEAPPAASASANAPADTRGDAPVAADAPLAAASASTRFARPGVKRPAVELITRHAVYTPVSYGELPGWSSDRFDESWSAFLQSCRVLSTRAAWSSPCADAARVDARDAAAIRAFYEQHFVAYRIEGAGRATGGLLTGYYEPIVRGSRVQSGRFVYPVYGVPRDMLYLDARRVPANARGTLTAARIEGREVIPLPAVSTGTLRATYALDLTDAVPDIRDKKIRMRVSERRIVPYYTRAEIERRGLQADVIAYVENPVQLYSMQLQGSGKIVMQDNSVVRVAYADQNGHPFTPPALVASSKHGQRVRVRGVDIDMPDDDAATDDSASAWPAPPRAPSEPRASEMADGQAAASPGTLSPLLAGAREEDSHADAGDDARGGVPENASRAGGRSRGLHLATDMVAPPAAVASVAARRVSTRPISSIAPDVMPIGASRPIAPSDPSYVFFRPIRDTADGPLGALGVPLSPGRSIAVDPRTTPLGAPVYLSARTGGANGLNRLLIAQDAGGAIRGAVRADLYWGSGTDAERLASTLKAPAQMWVLLPAGLNLAARDSGLRTRGEPSVADTPDCLIGDPVFCVDDDTH
ncbi:hypothetical protein CR51_13755 [Caballeronia megalochromosomata]|nr:hypothetical protein CR51_13755 [Caballeronia megalochromosomata]